MMRYHFLLLPLSLLLVSGQANQTFAERPIGFNRDVRAILTDKCFACHGPDAKTVEADLRLDLAEVATKDAIVPGDAKASELVKRIFSTDPDEIMPPAEAHKPLTDAERDILRRWVAEGAQYEDHWAYTPLVRPEPPDHPLAEASPIDRFIEDQLAEQKIAPLGPADRITLLRRISFDLTGMPPTAQEVKEFLADTSEDAYEKLIDRLLKSTRYGERMAIYWLDLVRYADTVGYHGDQNVSQSPYRDYVINAFNQNMPYDQFVREQLAGDLLPDATQQQRVASGYNRLNQTTQEGGSQAKEYLAIYFADRVRNVSQVFMGATMGCAQCHDHKYDPYTTKDFYSMGAFFADLDERGVYGNGRPPEERVPTPEMSAQINALDATLAELRGKIGPLRDQLTEGQADWEASILDSLEETKEVELAWVDDAQNTGGASNGDWKFVSQDKGPVHSGNHSRLQQSGALVQHFFDDAKKTVKIEENTRFYAWIYLDPKNPPKAVMLQLNDGSWEHRGVWGGDDIVYGRKPQSWAGYHRYGKLPETGQWVRLVANPADLGLKPGTVVKGMAFTQFAGMAHWDKAGWLSTSGIPQNVADAIVKPAAERSAAEAKVVTDYYVAATPAMVELKKKISDHEATRKRITDSAPLTVISRSVKPRTIRILPRGNWLDDSGEIVEPAIPEFLGKLELGKARPSRLDLANWLCSQDNVLTSRTMVNRLWALLFGRGICSSVDDFGGQGTYPSNPALLDWLASEFVASGWDIKHVIRQIVRSDAYQRTSKPTEQLRQMDPYNELFARQGRFRVDAEMIRDGALQLSGLLVEKIGGVSAKPYQPVGYYAQLNFPRRKYQADNGDNQYRRGVYTHWQRTFLHPMLKAFDAPSREECTAQRSRSNTPLQALTLLNDPTFVEAARVYAARILQSGGDSVDNQIRWAYETAVSREPEAPVFEILQSVHRQHLAHYRENKEEAAKVVSQGMSAAKGEWDPAELAAMTGVARVILNLHETITRY